MAASWLERVAMWFALVMLLTVAWPIGRAQAETRVALVIGNSAYRHTAALTNPQNDARDLAAALERSGFDVIVALDAEKRQIDGALRAFADKLAKADVALFFYAGHGLQVGQQNYLVPVDAQLQRERDLEFEAVKLDFVLRQMEIDREGKTTIVMLDACRDNPLTRNLARSMGTRSTALGQGLAAASTGVGTFIAYSTQPGNVALDGAGRNSPFTAALLAHIPQQGRNLNSTMIEVRKEVIKSTGGKQVPWDHSALTGDFYFVPGQVAPGAVAAGTTTPAPAAKSDDVEALKARLAALEAQQSQQTRAPGPDPARLNELRTRIVLAQEQAKSLQTALLEARRTEGQARDPAEKQRLQQASIKIQMDMTKAALTAKRLQEELAKLDAPVPPRAPPQPDQAQPRATYTVTAEHRALGDELPVFPSTANCESRCQSDSKCVAYNLSRDGVCELLSGVTRTVAATNWRTGLREGQAAAAAFTIPPVQPKPKVLAVSPNFEVADNVSLKGVEIGPAFRAPNPIACREACEMTSSCVGFQHGHKVPVMGQCALFSRIDTRHEDAKWRSGVRVAGAAATIRSKQGFDFHEGASYTGTVVKQASADSADSCMIVCRNTPACTAAAFALGSAGQGQCTVFSGAGQVMPQDNATAIVRSQ